ncbi:MAG: MMPL family transporter [Candidatus Neomarinimicrobiota bacterium]|nr:MMPL family transporter [Candidatus Neomarinimicrobiota bacterium]
MISRFKNFAVQQSINHPKRTFIISLVTTFIMATGLKHFVIEDDMMKMIPKTVKTRIVWEEVKDEFGNTELVFVAFGNDSIDLFNSKSFADLWDFTSQLESLPEVEDVRSLINLNKMENDDGFLLIDDLVSRRDLSQQQIQEIKNYLNRNNDERKRVISSKDNYFNVVVIPNKNIADRDAVAKIVETADSLLNNYSVHFGGPSYLIGVVGDLVRDDALFLIRIGLLFMVIILLASLRTFAGVMMVLLVIILSLVGMMGSMGWIRGLTGSDRFVFSIMNTSMPIILMTIANSDSVHFLTKFFKKLRLTGDKKTAIKQSIDSLMLPIFLTSLTTAVAFLSLVFAPIEYMTGYGVSIAIGICWAWILSVTLLPSLIMLKEWPLNSMAVIKPSILEKLVKKIGFKIVKIPRTILISSLLIVSIGVYGIKLITTEVNMISFFSKGNKVRNSLEFLDDNMLGSMDLEFLINGDLKDPVLLEQISQLQDYLEKNPHVSTSISIADVIKQMHRTVMDDNPDFEVIPKDQQKVNNLYTMYSMSGDPEDLSSLVDYEYSKALLTAILKNHSTAQSILFVNEIDDYVEQNFTKYKNIIPTGQLVVLKDMVDLVIKSSIISICVSIVLISLIASFFFRHYGWGFLGIIPLSAAVILNFGFMGIFGVHLNHVTALLSSVIIGVGVDFAIHYISQYRRLANQELAISKQTTSVIDEVGYPIVLDALSNMAFGALLFSEFIPLKHMGGLMVFAMVSTSFGTLTILACMLELISHKKTWMNSLLGR